MSMASPTKWGERSRRVNIYCLNCSSMRGRPGNYEGIEDAKGGLRKNVWGRTVRGGEVS